MYVYLASEYDEHELAHRLEKYIFENVQKQVKYSEDSGLIYIGCEYFYIYLDLNEGKEYVADICEDYSIEVNIGFDIEIYNKVYERATRVIAHIFSKLLEEYKGNFIVFDECTQKIIWRKEKLFVAAKYESFPFHELHLEYEEVMPNC